jgi:eukaryotic-like serine/threonine-protein kinase
MGQPDPNRPTAAPPATAAEPTSETVGQTAGEQPTQSLEASEIPRAPGLPADLRIGAYRVVRELGHGGMGSVYLAVRADEEYEKKVALKLIRGGAANAEVIERFRRERQILASLDHPNVARLLDGGTTEDGLPYFVMEYIEGTPITDYCDDKRLSTFERLKLFRSVCSAVEYAHRNLIIHRDIKPGNILVTAEGVPRLLDFGIAKLVDPGGGPEAAATSTAMTPAYASPEQVRGEPISTASDVYSLAVLLYEILTGHRPYRVKAGNPLELLKAVCEQEAEKPSTVVGRTREAMTTRTREGSVERLRHRLRGDLDNILMKALRKEPARRYPSVQAFSDDLLLYLEGRPVAAGKGTWGYRAWKFVKRNRLGVAAAVAAVVLVAGAAISTVIQSARVARERDKARTVSRFLVQLFQVSDPSEARGNSVTAREVLDKGAARIRGDLHEEPEVRAALLETIGTVYDTLGLYGQAVPLLDEALAIRRKLLGPDHLEVAATLNALGNVLLDKGDFRAAEAVYREALAIRKKRLSPRAIELGESLNNLAGILDHRGSYDEAESLYRQSLDIKRAAGGDTQNVANTLGNLAVMRHRKGDLDGTEALFREALAIQKRVLGADHPDVAFTMESLATTLDSKGDYAAAELLHREALTLQRKLFGQEHPDIALTLVNLGNTLVHRGDHAAAEPIYRECLAMSRKIFGSESADVANALAGLAGVESARGDGKAAEALWREVLGLREKLLGREHADTAEARASLAEALRTQGRLREAEPLHRDALAARRAALTAGHPAVADSLVGLGRTLAALGKQAEAATALREAVEIRRNASPSVPAALAEAETVLAQLVP